jgi:flagellar M-ring protein FliF
VISREITAPGKVEQMSVAVVMDDGSLTGVTVPTADEIELLVAAAVGLDTTRGDTISVSTIAFPAPEAADTTETPAAEAAPMDVMAMIPQIVGGLVLLLVVGALLMMARGSSKKSRVAALEVVQPALGGGGGAAPAGETDDGVSIHPEVMNLVQRQPEEIAVLLRSWLADRR